MNYIRPAKSVSVYPASHIRGSQTRVAALMVRSAFLTLTLTILVFSLLCFAPDLSFAQESATSAVTTTALDGAPIEGPGRQGLLQGLIKVMPLFGIIFFIFYFLVLRPQEKKDREQREILDALKSGLWVLTTGGLVGKVSSVEDEYVFLEVSNGVRVKFHKSSIVKEVGDKVASSTGNLGNSAKSKKKSA